MTRPEIDDCLVVVIDMHKGHIGPIATIPAPASEVDVMVPKLNNFLNEARKRNVPIVHVRFEAVKGIHNDHPAWIERWSDAHCLRGSATTEFVLKPEKGDYVIESKRTYNCFAHTDLEIYLKRLHRHTVVITGIATDCCCLATAFGAIDLHYKVIAISDCQVGMTPQSSAAALGIVADMLGKVMTSEQFVAEARQYA